MEYAILLNLILHIKFTSLHIPEAAHVASMHIFINIKNTCNKRDLYLTLINAGLSFSVVL